jgi:hypothetical protein
MTHYVRDSKVVVCGAAGNEPFRRAVEHTEKCRECITTIS